MSAQVDSVIVVAGEALVDLAITADGEISTHLGGGPYNVARTVGRLEQPVAYLGRLSRDRLGSRLRERLADDGVHLDAIVDTDDPTTLAFVDLDHEQAPTYRFYTAGTAAAGLERDAALDAYPASVAILHVGTLGLALEPTALALEALVAHADDETLVMVDPNCRPTAIPDPHAYLARLARVLARADVLKVSEDDLAWLAPNSNPVDAARALLSSSNSLALITRGADGAVVVTGTNQIVVPAPSVRVVDTIGAGDAFGGAFAAWWRLRGLERSDLVREDAVVDAVRFACLVAARTCEGAGALPPRAADLGQFAAGMPGP